MREKELIFQVVRSKLLYNPLVYVMNPIKNWIALFQKYIKNKFIRFLFVGGLNTVFGYSVYCLMIFLGLSYVLATFIQQVIGVMFNFITTGKLVFENSNKRLLLKFVICYVLTYFVNIGINKWIQISLGINEYMAGAGAIIISSLVSFFLLSYYVYK